MSNQNTNVKMASEAQYALYNKLCGIKKSVMKEQKIKVVSEKAFMKLTSRQASDKINQLQILSVVFKATDNQKQLIKTLCERCGAPMPKNVEEMTSRQASEFITKINAFIASKPALATEKQVERINNYIKAGLLTVKGLKKAHNVDTPEKLQKKDASDIIETFEDAYRQWRDTHVTNKQIEYIQSLQERLGDVVLPGEELLLMTRETASQLIEQLEKEWKNRKDIATANVGDYKDLTDRSKEMEAKMKLTISEREFDNKIEMANKLYVIIGQQPEGLDAVGFNEVDALLDNLVALARMYVSDDEIIESLGLHEIAEVASASA